MGLPFLLYKPYKQDFVKVEKLSVVKKGLFLRLFLGSFSKKAFQLWVYPHFPQSFPQSSLKTYGNFTARCPGQEIDTG